MNFHVVVLLLVLSGVASCGGSPETGNGLPAKEITTPVRSDGNSTPPVDSVETLPVDSVDEETIPDLDEDHDLGQELEVPPEPPLPPGFPDDTPADDLDDYVADDDDRIPEDNLDPTDDVDPEFDHCSLLEQVTGR